MGRWRALRAEVLARLDDPAAEDLFPQAVDHDARDERVALVHEPARQAQAIRGLSSRIGCSALGVPA